MSWDVVLPPEEGRRGLYGNRDAMPFMISVSRQGKSIHFRLVIQGHPSKVPSKRLDWWRANEKVSVRTDNAGTLNVKLDSTGLFTLSRLGSHPNSPVGLRLNLPTHLSKEPVPREPVESYEFGADYEVTLRLPVWAREQKPPQLSVAS